jgi:NAD+ synthase
MPVNFEPEKIITTLKRFLTNMMLRTGSNGYVIGLSGGIDSALSATLAVEAVGANKVFGILMPYKLSSDSSITDAMELVEKLKIDYIKIDISPMIDIYYDKIDDSNRLRAGNKMARERMSILFDKAHEMNRLVLGTGNRTEICLGYTTWYGDSACSVNPLGELYKTEVRQLAKILGIPDSIITKSPSADLWAGQTDEDEIGVSYEQIDNLLKELIDNNIYSISELEKKGLNTHDISRVVSMINSNYFKRKLPEIAPLERTSIPDNIQLEE